ncbi:unnamed protein product [Rotaria socialis]|uniref:Uncharacterized protein n=1 Tax=Rotaria socialis TaxID=392032 RepID=A0A820YU55_9BILA|nr:unnamed protein product [Rotaria socialis]CAF4801521.1 unnamed protein product [Rotaria socialis]
MSKKHVHMKTVVPPTCNTSYIAFGPALSSCTNTCGGATGSTPNPYGISNARCIDCCGISNTTPIGGNCTGNPIVNGAVYGGNCVAPYSGYYCCC